jgi:RHH-type transcriptional regulator, proline utilization regulon repressor / proline dehydrogenase / delta 1-pyrroline-5-carboxylate dehydrogenase
MSEALQFHKSASAMLPPLDDIAAHALIDEDRLVTSLIDRAAPSAGEQAKIAEVAQRLAAAGRDGRLAQGGIDAFMHEYALSSEEGVILMCLAEALLRIPDRATADALIADKISEGRWDKHLGHSGSLFVNASTWGLLLSGRTLALEDGSDGAPANILKRLVARSGKPVIREAMRQAMRILGDQFVLAPTISRALGRAQAWEAKGYRMAYDMLGEAARTAKDAERYFGKYAHAIEAIGQATPRQRDSGIEGLMARPNVSVKLSALHPRFEPQQAEYARPILVKRLLELARVAKGCGLSLTIDAEEAERLELTLLVFGDVALDPALEGWHGLGIAVQAYSKRALPVLRWLRKVAEQSRHRIPVRLVKGAYWDSEIKWGQERGLIDYPVLTRKSNTDVSYLACMRWLLSEGEAFYPQFATHNAHSIASAHIAGNWTGFEMQRLHGMAEGTYTEVVGKQAGALGRACRIYAPVGDHDELLAYLVRRLLENGANTSFINRLADDATSLDAILRDPVEAAERVVPRRNPKIPKPADVFQPERRNSAGIAMWETQTRLALVSEIQAALRQPVTAGPIVGGRSLLEGEPLAVLSPHDRRVLVGHVHEASAAHVDTAMTAAFAAQRAWDRGGPKARGDILLRAADLLELNRSGLMALIVREAGKTLEAALGDVREAVDYLRYYAVEARRLLAEPRELKGTTGERNLLSLHGRGVFACISPWNFPLAIFVGQISAALAAGNTVVAKPAEQTPLAAFKAVQLLHQAGIPTDVLHLLPGDGRIGAAIVADPRLGGIAFTGSNATAWTIQRALAERRGPLIPFIAETGGMNAMIADSSAVPEQVTRDCVHSAFDSAGQRCSAARVLFVQDEMADRTIELLTGSLLELTVGDPLSYSTDIGPVIDEDAQEALQGHKLHMRRSAKELLDPALPTACHAGTFVAPALYEIDRLDMLDGEVFGPVLHVIRYRREHLDKVCDAINASGYGLTLGLHSRIDAVHEFVAERVRVGNFYVNRNQIGAVVGVQPFGGEGLSGTGPKAGGPYTLLRYVLERVRTIDLTASGGNRDLLSPEE